MDISLEKKESLYHNLDRYLTSEYKLTSDEDPQIEDENTSAFCTLENSYIMYQLAGLRSYHAKSIEIIDILYYHLGDRVINKEFTNALEWEEISEFCASTNALTEKISDAWDETKKLDDKLKELGELSPLEIIKHDLNIRKLADPFREAQYVILGADKSFRKMAHKFNISPRQNQHVRNRLDDWPKKDAKKIIQMVQGSYLCPCGCMHNLITNRRHVDITDDKFYWQIRYRDRKLTIPESYRNKKDITPIAIAEKVWGRKLKLVDVIA